MEDGAFTVRRRPLPAAFDGRGDATIELRAEFCEYTGGAVQVDAPVTRPVA